eukprot:UN33237
MSDSDVPQWIEAFTSVRGHEYFCKVAEAFISDNFNLYGLPDIFPYHVYLVQLILDKEQVQKFDEEFLDDLDSEAELFYCMIHQRYITTGRGLVQMCKKYQNGEFGHCPNYFCRKQPVLPVGLHSSLGNDSIKIYCPSCEKVYRPASSRSEHVDGAAFGPTFPHLFFLTFPELKPDAPPEKYVPKIYGFRVHPKAYAMTKKQQTIMQKKLAAIKDKKGGKKKNNAKKVVCHTVVVPLTHVI